jgi:succinate dehydrogenase/fumarate reductase flavoprotein subunit
MNYKTLSTDVLVIGGGGAGLRAAIEARKSGVEVTLVSKKKAAHSCSTALAVGLITCSRLGFNKQLFHTIIEEGGFLNNQRLVELFVSDVGQRVRELSDFGVILQFVKKDKARFYNPRKPVPLFLVSQSEKARSLGLTEPLRAKAENLGVKIIDDVQITKLLKKGDSVVGATAIRTNVNEFLVFVANSTILATGGATQIYLRTDNPPVTTGDGYALAYHAGAELVDMEFVTFNIPSHRNGNISTERFKKLASDAIADLKRNNDKWSFDSRINSHYFSGGVRINAECRTRIARLYAAGEVTGGLFGSARLGGSALADIIVFGAIAGRNAALNAKRIKRLEPDQRQIDEEKARLQSIVDEKNDNITPQKIQREIKSIMWNYVAFARTEDSLKEAGKQLDLLRKEIPRLQSGKDGLSKAIETINMLEVSSIVTASALERTESRGAHWRLDYPNPNNKKWLKNIIVHCVGTKKIVLTAEAPVITCLHVPNKIHVGTPWSGYFS